MAKNFNIKITLTDEEIEMVKAFTKAQLYGEGSFHDTLRSILYLQLREDIDLYKEEYEQFGEILH